MAEPQGVLMTGQRGQVLAFFAVVLPIALVPIVTYAIDSAAVDARAAGLQAAAAQAVEVAAQQVDGASLRSSGRLLVDPTQADRMAAEVLRAEEPGATLDQTTVVGAGVTVSASERVELPIPWLENSVTLHSRASARLVPGYESPSSRLPLPASSF